MYRFGLGGHLGRVEFFWINIGRKYLEVKKSLMIVSAQLLYKITVF